MSRFGPEFVAEKKSERLVEQQLRVPEQLDCWPGHFPHWTVVPGVLQLDWVLKAIASWIGTTPRIARIERLKFKRPMGPGQAFTLTVERGASRAAFGFRLASGGDTFSVGRVVLRETGESRS